MRAWTYQGHVSPDNVEQLRQFVDAGPPKPAADACKTRVVPRCLLDRGAIFKNMHGSKFEDIKSVAVEAVAFLQKENWRDGSMSMKIRDEAAETPSFTSR